MVYREILKEYSFEILTPKDFNLSDEPEENEKTFEANAIKKALFYSSFSDLPVLAEDSGLEIDYLNGEPGVLSRRWPGYAATDEELVNIVLNKLKGVPREKRGAQFKVVMALKFPAEDNVLTSEGILHGYLTEESRAKIIPGYPFRSLFYVPEIGKTLGELTMEEEAKIAHRKKALQKFLPLIFNKINI